jgi:hypothetical protein
VGDPTIRRYITCPDCGRSAPDAGGRCADCHDHARLRDAVAEWAAVSGEYGSFSDYSTACDKLRVVARELGLVAHPPIDCLGERTEDGCGYDGCTGAGPAADAASDGG